MNSVMDESDTESVEVKSSPGPSSKSRFWDPKSELIVEKHFAEYIKNSKQPILAVRGGILNGKPPKQVQDKVKTFIR